ncbi:MAG TPA: type II toxin-antitoxin system HicA family toxin [Aestuariivirga sp.]|nr:type II toxin-antitoxin system HicA family toxin [Aestuariivirga sp.]
MHKVREVISMIKHPEKPGRVTVAGKMSDDMAPGTFNSIMKQAGLKEKS